METFYPFKSVQEAHEEMTEEQLDGLKKAEENDGLEDAVNSGYLRLVDAIRDNVTLADFTDPEDWIA